MLNTLIYRKLNHFASMRGDLASSSAHLGLSPIETLRSEGECVHLVSSMGACKTILSDDASFAPAPIAEAVRIIGERFGLEVREAYEFLRENPMQLTDDAHQARRRQHLGHYATMLKNSTATFRQIADACFDVLAGNPPRSLVRDVVEPFVDGALGHIATQNGIVPTRFLSVCQDNHVLLEHVHHPRKLERKSRQIAAFNSADAPQDNILLSYALQGRDPMIGGITAFLHHLFQQPPADRADVLDKMTASTLYRITSPVNYIGRIARCAVTVDGVEISPGDQILLLLPAANGDPAATTDQRGVAFGAGGHTCAGQALALSITDAFLGALRNRFADVDWSGLQTDLPIPAVFRQYEAQS